MRGKFPVYSFRAVPQLPVGTAQVLNERINVFLALSGLQGVHHVGKIGSQVFLNKGARAQLQAGQVAHLQKLSGQMQGQKIPCGILVGQEGFKQPVMGNR